MRAFGLLLLSACTDYNLKEGKEETKPGGEDSAADSADPLDSGDPQDSGRPIDTSATEPSSPEEIYANSPTDLFSWDAGSGALTRIGPFMSSSGPITQMTDIAIDLDGNMMGVAFSTLYAIDGETGDCIFRATLADSMNALTFLSDGRLVGTGGSSIYEIDRSTGALSEIASSPWSSSGDIVGLPDGMLYWTVTGGDYLMKVNPSTGAVTTIGNIGTGSVWGLAYTDGTLYGFTPDGSHLAIDPATGSRLSGGSTGEELWGATTNPFFWD